MGQQLPNFQNGQFPQGLLNGAPFQAGAMTGGFPALSGALPGGIAGVDPRMMAQAQQQVANPDAGDMMGILPGPKELAMGGAAGAATAASLYSLMGKDNDGFIPKFANWVDSFKGVNSVSHKLEQKFAQWTQGDGWLPRFLKESWLTRATQLNGQTPQQAAAAAVQAMEARQIQLAMANFPRRFSPELKQYYEAEFLKNQKSHIIKAYDERLTQYVKGQMERLSPDDVAEIARLNQGRLDRLNPVKAGFFNFADNNAAWLKNTDQLGFDKALTQLKAQLRYLEGKEKLAPQEAKILEKLRGLHERIGGLKHHYRPSFEAQAQLTAKLASQASGANKATGPIGRGIALFSQYIQRIFNGDTMSMGSGGASRFFGPVLAGGIIFGQSFTKAKNAQPGEKKKAFFHDFLGTGIGNFIGWELGRKWLNSSGVMHKVLGKGATLRPFDNKIGRWMPIFGEKFGSLFGKGILSKIAGRGLGGFFASLTLGGLATELLAMFAFGSAAQFVSEKISHLIFGKPSKESIEGKAARKQPGQAPNGMNPMQQGQPGIPQQANAAAFNQGMMANSPLQRTAFNGQPAAMPQAQAAQIPGGAQSAPMPRTLEANQPSPGFSLSPESITQSPQASAMQNLSNQLRTDADKLQNKNKERVNYFNAGSF